MKIFLGIVGVIGLIAWLGFIAFICYKDYRKLQRERQAKIDMYNNLSLYLPRIGKELVLIREQIERK